MAAQEPRGEGAPARIAPGALAGASVAELIGTFMLVFFGAGTVLAVVKLQPEAPLDDAAIGLAFGFVILVIVYAFGHSSGAHVNPSVTIGLAVVRKFPWVAVPFYLVAQFTGALLAALLLWALFGDELREQAALGATLPGEGVSDGTVLLAEVIITFVLLVVVMATATDERASPPAVGLAIGLTIGIGVFAMLPISGGSFNAARTFGPMIVAAEFDGWWAYLVGPLAGGIVGAAVYELLVRRGSPPTVAGAIEERPKA